MAWMDNLYETYENNRELVGVKDDAGNMLLPIAHSVQNAQIEVAVSYQGEFLNARILEKAEAETLIPVTEDSVARSSGIAPHPLHDKLIYVAGDYEQYCSKKKATEYHEAYMSQLDGWCESQYSNAVLLAIRTYLEKNCLIRDLIASGVLQEKDGVVDPKVKLQTTYSQEDALIRFYVDDFRNPPKRPWNDPDFFKSYTQYYISKQQTVGLCYVTGSMEPLCEKHPSRIRHAADKAKLISANDSSGFTYRGRFDSKDQVAGISYKVSQEAHNALKWLLQKQGYVRDGLALVAWENRLTQIPDLMSDSYDLFGDDFFGETAENTEVADTNESYGNRLKSAIKGYRQNLSDTSKVTVISVDAATPGRLSIIYYREIAGSDFLNHIEHWQETCAWVHQYKWKDKIRQVFVGAPSLKDIVLAAFGTEQNGMLKVSDKLMSCLVGRLLPCVIDQAKLPYDFAYSAYQRALTPLSMSEENWNKVLTIACSLVCKYRLDRFGEEWKMNLEESKDDYTYLCGRLLAIADEIEGWALSEMGAVRPTNAKKYFNQFAKNPNKIWITIIRNLEPYEEKLGVRCKHLLELREEISSRIPADEFVKLRNLDGRFVLGYDSQKRALKLDKDRRIAEKKKTEMNA